MIKLWLTDAVRTSEYIYSHPSISIDDMNIDQFIDELIKVSDSDAPALNGALLPARRPKDLSLPSNLYQHWDMFISKLIVHSGSLHPVVKHLLLGLALDDDNQNIRSARLDSIKNLFLEGRVFQPTMTWASLLCPDWFSDKVVVKPSLRGGNTIESTKGVTTSLLLTKDKIRINPASLFTSTQIVDVLDAQIMASPNVWHEVALLNQSLDYPLVTSNWLYALADKKVFWEDVTIGSALYSPFYTSNDIDLLMINHCNTQGAGFYVRPGNGISDIYPIVNDPVLSTFINCAPIYDAPFWTGLSCTIMNLISHPGSPVGLPLAWCEKLLKEIKLTDSLDILPIHSAFSNKDAQGLDLTSPAYVALEKIVTHQDPCFFKDFVVALLNTQQVLASTYKDLYVDSADTGYPHSFKHFKCPAIQVSSIPNMEL